MWAQDAAAMFGYASASASAAMLTPFESPPQTTNPAASADSAGGVAEGVGRAAAQRVAAAAAELPSAAAGEELEFLVVLADLLTVFLAVPAFYSLFIAVPANVVGLVGFPVSVYGLGAGLHTDEIISGWEGIEPFPSTEPAPVKPFPAPLLNLPAGTIPPPSVVAGRGDSSVVGELSVPPTWTVATEAVEPVAYTLPGTAANADAIPAAGPDSGGTLSEMALAGMAGRVMADAVGSGAGRAARGTRAALIGARPVSVTDARRDSGEAVPRGPARAVVTGVASELREFAKLRDEGLLTDDEYAVQRRRLLGG